LDGQPRFFFSGKSEVVVAYAPTNLGYDLKIAIKIMVIESSK
jgi:hypothetical protein